MPSVLQGRWIYINISPDSGTCSLFSPWEGNCVLPWLGRKRDSPLLSPTWQPQKLYPAPMDTWLYHLRREWQASGRKPGELSLRNSQGDSGWVRLVLAPCNQTCCSMGTLYPNRNRGKLWFLPHVSEINLIPLTWPKPILAYQTQAWNCS